MSDLQTSPCPTCRKPVSTAPSAEKTSRPFCSERCRLVDLSKWFGGDYAVPDHDATDEMNDDMNDMGEG